MATPPHEPGSVEPDCSRPNPSPGAVGGLREVLSALAVMALVAGAVWGVYGRAIHSPFIFDDGNSVTENPTIKRLRPLLGDEMGPGPLVPRQDSVTAGRPLVNLSLAINYRLGQLDPAGYHVFNLLLHVLSATLVWAIVRRTLLLDYFGGRFGGAASVLGLLVALVWALHPLAIDAVEYVSQRTELMMGFFYLATLYGSLRYFAATSSTPRGAWLALATLACASGMACKEVMVTAPVMVLLFERTFIAGSFRRALKRSWPLYVGLAAGWALLFALNIGGPRARTAGFDSGVPAYVWWLTQSGVLLMYLKLALWPWPLAIHYHVPYLFSMGEAWPWLVLVVGLGIATVALLWRRWALGYVGAWVFIILSPTLVVPIATEVAAERRMYLPLAAIVALAIASGFVWIDETLRSATARASESAKSRSPLVITAVGAAMLAVVFALIDVRRLAVFSDLLTLWQDTVARQPDDPLANVSLGVALTQAGRPQHAIEFFEHALELGPDTPQLKIHKQLGTALAAAGWMPDAARHLQEALKLEPDNPALLQLLSVTLVNAGRAPEAVEHLERALETQSSSAPLRDNLGVALINAGRVNEAIDQLEQAVRLQSDYVSAYANLAIAYDKVGRSIDAETTAQKGLGLAKAQGLTAAANQLEAWLKQHR